MQLRLKRHWGTRIAVLVVAAAAGGACARQLWPTRTERFVMQSEVCKGYVVLVARAIEKHAEQHQGVLPTSLGVLASEGLVERWRLRCPTTGKQYLYWAEGRKVKEGDITEGQPLIMDAGFPHAGKVKIGYRWRGGIMYVRYGPSWQGRENDWEFLESLWGERPTAPGRGEGGATEGAVGE